MDTQYEVYTTRFVPRTVIYSWKVLGLSCWPANYFKASSPTLDHPTCSRWRVQLIKHSSQDYNADLELVSSVGDVPVRASVKIRAYNGIGNPFEVATNNHEFKIGYKWEEQLRNVSVPKSSALDWLQLEVEVTVIQGVVETALRPLPSLQDDLAALLKTEAGADVTLRPSRGPPILAHSAVLSARCPVFAKLLQLDDAAAGHSLDVDDVEPKVLKALLKYAYTDEVPSLKKRPHKLFEAASRFQLLGLKRLCELELLSKLTVETAANTAVLGVTHYSQTLLATVIPFIHSQYGAVTSSAGWAQAVRTHPTAFSEVSLLVEAAAKGELFEAMSFM